MTGPVVVGYTGSDESKAALTLTRELAGLLYAPVVSVSVITSAPLETDLRTFTADLQERGERLKAEALDALSGRDEVEAISVPAPSPARELDRIAGERDAVMVVLGSTHRGALGRLVPGTVADRLLAGGRCPVAVAPRGFAPSADRLRLRRFGVAFDGSPEARVALAEAARLALAADASLDLLAVVNPAMPAELPWAAQGYAALTVSPRITRQQVDHMWSCAEKAVQDLVPDVVRATIHVVEGLPTEVLLQRSKQFDLLLVGSRGYGPLGRVLMGSVSTTLVRECTCPVIVTPRPKDSRGETAASQARDVVSA